MKRLIDYRSIIGDEEVYALYKRARPLYGKKVLHLNSTYQGGGVAEMLASLIPLMNDVGLKAGWRILHGNNDFFAITKKIHNGLQGEVNSFTDAEKKWYLETNEAFAAYTHIDHDYLVIHDPQPLPLIQFFKKRQPWIWRCHIDLSTPNDDLWQFIKGFVLRYDKVIISNEHYRRPDLPNDDKIVCPAIDPLTSKNMELSPEEITTILDQFRVPRDKPMLLQVSRFDKWKDPEGVLEVYKEVRKKADCRLVMCGSMAPDDPEGLMIYEKVREKAAELIESGDVILITSENSKLVNALQRSAQVIMQKSVREGFGLTVTEALWKGVPVVASDVGGIPLQIQNEQTGFLCPAHDNDSFVWRVLELMKHPDKAAKMGQKGREHVRKNFLITRVLADYLDLFNSMPR